VSWCIQVFNAATALSEQESAQLASLMQMRLQTDLGNASKASLSAIDTVMPNSVDYVVESWNDGAGGWYRRYRSGWVEQGGKTTLTSTITFPVPFADEHAYYMSSSYDNNGGRGCAISFETRTTTSTVCRGQWTDDGKHGYTSTKLNVDWYACGKAATE
jgi:hypothetical protein